MQKKLAFYLNAKLLDATLVLYYFLKEEIILNRQTYTHTHTHTHTYIYIINAKSNQSNEYISNF